MVEAALPPISISGGTPPKYSPPSSAPPPETEILLEPDIILELSDSSSSMYKIILKMEINWGCNEI